MIITQPNTELEYELQELYILARHWLQDIAFAQDELRFFSNMLKKYQENTTIRDLLIKRGAFSKKIADQNRHIATLKNAIPEFLNLLEPHIRDPKIKMELNVIEQYNAMNTNIQALLHALKITKLELFAYTEAMIDAHQKNSAYNKPQTGI
jgi:hypothetical protein